MPITAYPLRPARMHEVSGPAAVSFALRGAQESGADLLWVRERWQTGQLNPLGFDGFDPARLLMAMTRDQTETLAVTEEALRDGSLRCVVAEITAPLGLTIGRRLQLAAQAGGTTGLCLTPEGMGSNAAETRWHCAPVFDPDDSTLQRWKLIKNKSGTLGTWHVRWDAEARRIAVVSPSGHGPGSQGASD
ncbi:ImuA family protein [Paracoccus homiensis]|uniref:ImuA family protein n=1 Tax=Paracoccus homiensis TaxID=364199 RepID=UPI000AB2CE0E|nr:hypothetical protein [Paracoccus homiensis]